MGGYHTVVQNYRMISKGKKRGWPPEGEIYSTAAIGMDSDRHVLFILSRSPYSTHDLILILLNLPYHSIGYTLYILSRLPRPEGSKRLYIVIHIKLNIIYPDNSLVQGTIFTYIPPNENNDNNGG